MLWTSINDPAVMPALLTTSTTGAWPLAHLRSGPLAEPPRCDAPWAAGALAGADTMDRSQPADARDDPGHGLLGAGTHAKESAMVTCLVSTAPRGMAWHEVLGHLAILEQATRAVHEGYLGPPLYHQAAHTAQRLLWKAWSCTSDEGRERTIRAYTR
jgi:hypothetical protein